MELIQAANFTEARRRSDTELARLVASGQGWQFDDDQVCDHKGQLVAFTIEDLAAYGREAGWFAPNNAGIMWGAVGVHSDVAATVRGRLDARGRFL